MAPRANEERKKLILRILKERADSRPAEDTFELAYEDFIQGKSRPISGLGIKPLATEVERKSLLALFKAIEKESKNAVTFSFPKRKPIKLLGGLISQLELREINRPVIYAYIDDSEKFNEYYKKVTQPPEKIPTFILNDEGKLYRADDKKKRLIYPMIRNGLRCKIVHYLTGAKNYVQTTELADEFGKKPQEIRKIIERIRERITERLKIPGDKVIENSPGSGYRIKNIRLKEK